jgi:cell division protein FtsW (lipid II flippase)
MLHLFVQASKYLMILLFLVYTYQCFHVFRFEGDEEAQKSIYRLQRSLLFYIHLDAYLVLYLTTQNMQVIGFYLMQLVVLAAVYAIYHLFYRHASELVLNNMCMLLVIGFIILTRISFEKAFRQFLFSCAGFFVSLLIPLVLQSLSLFRKLTWVYAVVGIGALLVVAVAGQTSYGAKLSLSIAGITVQPSEFVKIIFVLFIASMLYLRQDFRQVVITSVISAVFVLALVASRDLGGALLYFFTYLVMVYVATRRFAYFGGGLCAMAAAAVVGYRLFSHVQARVLAWMDPLSVIDNEGYQVSQSLFAIGTGGWFGLGLGQGLPNKIPVVTKDFVFAAISEEMGGLFALCLIMVCLSCFFMIMNVAMRLRDPFYRLSAVGLGTLYALQVFLTIGGVIKFIPSTGVTLPLVSYGGSSLLATMIVFGIIQGLYIVEFDERAQSKEKQQKGGQPRGAKRREKTKE